MENGDRWLSDEVRCFLYITNDQEMTVKKVVPLADNRCNRENAICRQKSGGNALRMLSEDLVSNRAYIVIEALAWNLRASRNPVDRGTP